MIKIDFDLIGDSDEKKFCEDFVDGAHHGRRLPAGQAQQGPLQQRQACFDCLQANWKKQNKKIEPNKLF
jgi:hypothetical protein